MNKWRLRLQDITTPDEINLTDHRNWKRILLQTASSMLMLQPELAEHDFASTLKGARQQAPKFVQHPKTNCVKMVSIVRLVSSGLDSHTFS